MNFHSDEWIMEKVADHLQEKDDSVDHAINELLDDVAYKIMEESVQRDLFYDELDSILEKIGNTSSSIIEKD